MHPQCGGLHYCLTETVRVPTMMPSSSCFYQLDSRPSSPRVRSYASCCAGIVTKGARLRMTDMKSSFSSCARIAVTLGAMRGAHDRRGDLHCNIRGSQLLVLPRAARMTVRPERVALAS